MTLDEQRKEWEKTLEVIAETRFFHDVHLVILRRKAGMRDGKQDYFCHRYFSICDNWEVSVDASNVDAETAMKWAWNPKALPRESEEE